MRSNELETIQAVMAIADVQATHVSIYLTIVFSYFVVAYVAGHKLTRFQLGLASFIFVCACTWELFMISTRGQSASFVGRDLLQDSEVQPLFNESVRVWIVRILWSSGMFAALVFMWNVRTSKEDRQY